MPSYKRIYNFLEILYIIVYNFLEILYFKSIEINANKKERQSLTSLTQLVRNTYMFNYYFLFFLMKCRISHFFQYLVCPRFLHSPFGISPLATMRFNVASET